MVQVPWEFTDDRPSEFNTFLSYKLVSLHSLVKERGGFEEKVVVLGLIVPFTLRCTPTKHSKLGDI